MNKFFAAVAIFFVIAIALILVLFAGWRSTYNTFVSKEERVKQTWGNVQSAYQRRLDLIPNLVATVKGYALHESKTLEEVAKARQQVTTIDLRNLKTDAETQKKFLEAQQSLGASLGRLLAIKEAYPDLKADKGFRDLQSQIEGTENRISVERMENQAAINSYNVELRGFFARTVANHYGFTAKEYFQSATGAEKAPTVNFQ